MAVRGGVVEGAGVAQQPLDIPGEDGLPDDRGDQLEFGVRAASSSSACTVAAAITSMAAIVTAENRGISISASWSRRKR